MNRRGLYFPITSLRILGVMSTECDTNWFSWMEGVQVQ